ncbi:hypothetical protein DPMN_169891 [Dreissena polymorpha]|uniref:Uncharacterized protein n=1 Tax=Dreissena polymorpha TaxID=45954 RepID=A0A9D4DXC5_DREPO|nr:hypothetical protein DPMN_169891 [Dreissena polymorpha]
MNASPANELRLPVLTVRGARWGCLGVDHSGTVRWDTYSQTPEIVRFSNILECTDTRESCPVTSNIELSESVVSLQVVSLAPSDNGEDGEDPLVVTGGRLCLGESPWIGDTGVVVQISGVWLETGYTGMTLGGGGGPY